MANARESITEELEQEAGLKIEIGRLIPEFKLLTSNGLVIDPTDFKQKKNLVIYFFDVHKSESWEMLAMLRQRYNEFKDANAEVLAISPGSMEEIQDCVSSMNLPFPVLCDSNGEVAAAYAATKPALFVADRYGELKMFSEVTSDNIETVIESALSTLDLVELECPECGVPTWSI